VFVATSVSSFGKLLGLLTVIWGGGRRGGITTGSGGAFGVLLTHCTTLVRGVYRASY